MADLFGHEAQPVSPGMVEVACELRAEMRDAIAIVPGDGFLKLNDSREPWVWLPLSEVKSIQRGRSKSAVITIPNWLAKEKGLT